MNYSLDKLMKQVRGVSYSKNDASLTYKEGFVPVLRAGNIQNSRIIHDDFVYIPKEGVKNVQLLKKGDVLIAASSGSISIVGKAAMILQDMNAGFGAFCKVLRPNKEIVNEDYFKFYFETPHYKNTISQLAEGANINNLKTEHFDNLEIYLPPLPQQQKIANILDAADALRQNDKALIAKYDELTQALFLDMFGDPVINPKGWEKVELKKLCSFKKKNIKPEDIEEGENYVALDSIEKVTGNITTVYNVEKGELKSNKFWFDNSFILYGKLRPYLNKVALPNFEGVCSTDIIPIQPINTKSNRLFITSILRHNSFVAFADERSSGANLPRISPTEVEKYSTINPPLDLQNQFAERVAVIEEQKAIAQKSLEQSESLFNSLLQKAFKGELI
jgi:type I restriction enzyme S subunit